MRLLACYHRDIETVKRLALIAIFTSSCWAGEFAVLQNGFRIAAIRHEVVGSLVRLETAHGSMDVPATEVTRFEQEEFVPEKPKPAEANLSPAPISEAKLTPEEMLTEAAAKHGLRPEFVKSVAAIESALRENAISPKGAIGLMQLMPGTAADLGVNPHDPRQNADGGVRYLKELLLKYKDHADPVRLALAAYNAGPGAVDRHRSIPPFRETQAYVEKVLRKYLQELKSKS